jgi:hypothetical protein
MGKKQTSQWVFAMSALPPEADISWRDHNVRQVPQADIAREDTSSDFRFHGAGRDLERRDTSAVTSLAIQPSRRIPAE